MKNNQSTDEKLCQKRNSDDLHFARKKMIKWHCWWFHYKFTSFDEYRINLLISMSGKTFFGILRNLILFFDAFLLIVVLLFVAESKRNVTREFKKRPQIWKILDSISNFCFTIPWIALMRSYSPKGDLIWESSSLWLKSQRPGAKSLPWVSCF